MRKVFAVGLAVVGLVAIAGQGMLTVPVEAAKAGKVQIFNNVVNSRFAGSSGGVIRRF